MIYEKKNDYPMAFLWLKLGDVVRGGRSSPPQGGRFRRHPPKNIKKMQILNKKAQNNNFWNIFSVFDKFQPSPLIFWGVTSVTSFVPTRNDVTPKKRRHPLKFFFKIFFLT